MNDSKRETTETTLPIACNVEAIPADDLRLAPEVPFSAG